MNFNNEDVFFEVKTIFEIFRGTSGFKGLKVLLIPVTFALLYEGNKQQNFDWKISRDHFSDL
jgi:hypothetical protein